jgi:hypothetical protein
LFARYKGKQTAGKDPYGYFLDEGYFTKVDPNHRTMAEYFTTELTNAILAYNPSFPLIVPKLWPDMVFLWIPA